MAAGGVVLLAACSGPRQLVAELRDGGAGRMTSAVGPSAGGGVSLEPWERRNPKWVQVWYDTDSGHAEVNPNYQTPGPGTGPSRGGKPGDGSVGVFSYHIPAGRQAMLQSAFLFWRRDAAATTPRDVFLEFGIINTAVFHDQSGDVTKAGMDFIPPVDRGPADNAPGQQANLQWTGALYLPAGTRVFLNQYDTSAGGACSYKAQMQIIEYDA